MIGIVAFTKKGCELGKQLSAELSGKLWAADRLAEELELPGCGSLSRWAEARFQDCEALVFVCASGIAVRAIAPFVKDKFTDPAVVSVDEAGRFAVPLLSGHVGGANDLARRIASFTGGQAAISTATDVNGLFAVDQWAREQNLVLCERKRAKEVSAALLEGRPVGLKSSFAIQGSAPRGFSEAAKGELGVCISDTAAEEPFSATLHLVPKAVTLGIGCRRGTPKSQLREGLLEFLKQSAIPQEAVIGLASIDLKQDEPGLLDLAGDFGWPLKFFTAQELSKERGDFAPSGFVKRITGVDNVCQRAAQRAGGRIIVSKTVCGGSTFSAAMGKVTLSWPTKGAFDTGGI